MSEKLDNLVILARRARDNGMESTPYADKNW